MSTLYHCCCILLIVVDSRVTRRVTDIKLEAKDVLPNINCMQATKRAENAVFVPGDLHLWLWPSNLSEQGTKHVFHVNLAQIRSVVPEIFHTQTKKVRRRQKQEPTQFTACSKNVHLLEHKCRQDWNSFWCCFPTLTSMNFSISGLPKFSHYQKYHLVL